MDHETPLTIEEYMRLPYRMEVYYDEDHWAAEFPELPGLVAGHETWEGLQATIDDAKRAYFAAAIDRGLPIPQPRTPQDAFSGRLMVRMPKSMHREAARGARREGVSLNAFITAAVARELGRHDEWHRPAEWGFAAGVLSSQRFFTEQEGPPNFAEYIRLAGSR
jgi:antitoxin HicB